MSEPHSDDYCIVCGREPSSPGPKMHPIVGIEDACVCGECTTPGTRNSEFLELADEWRNAARGGTAKSGQTAFLTCADELETVIDNKKVEYDAITREKLDELHSEIQDELGESNE